MGGLVAMRALTKYPKLFESAVDSVVFLNSPLSTHPLLNGLSHAFLRRAIALKISQYPPDFKFNPLLLSVTSGSKDDLVNAEATVFPRPLARRTTNAWEVRREKSRWSSGINRTQPFSQNQFFNQM